MSFSSNAKETAPDVEFVTWRRGGTAQWIALHSCKWQHAGVELMRSCRSNDHDAAIFVAIAGICTTCVSEA